jgi:hypothetical protein
MQKERNSEIGRYQEALRESRRKEREKNAEIDKAIQEDANRVSAQQLKVWTAEAAARRQLLCDVAVEQKKQREEKCVNE